MFNIGFIGTGNMGGALLRAVSKETGGERIFAADYFSEKARNICEDVNAHESTNEEIARNCKYIFLGVKPQIIKSVIKEIVPVLKSRKDRFILVSMAAGVSTKDITEAAGDFPVIRIMPNTPCGIGSGVILHCTNGKVTAAEIEDFEALLQKAGITDSIDESLMDAASAVSGCGPAFVYMFIEALSDGGVYCGLPRDKALRYAAQTVMGAAQTLLETNLHPGVLKDAVTSPGGTTIAGVKALEDGGFRAAAAESVIKAFERTKALKK